MFFVHRLRSFGLRIGLRARIVISSIFVSLILLLAISLPFTAAPFVIPLLLVSTYLSVWFAILDDIHNFEWVGLFLLPVVWVPVWYVFFFLAPTRGLTRITFVLTNIAFFYTFCSISNIFNVWVTKSIQLHRVAYTVNILLSTVLFFLFSLTSFTFQIGWASYAVLFLVFGFLFSVQRFWSIDPSTRLSYANLHSALYCAAVIALFIAILSFLPFVGATSLAVAITGLAHLLVGLISLHKQDVVFSSHVREYLYSFVILVVVVVLTIRW
jgi:hypothetical protein